MFKNLKHVFYGKNPLFEKIIQFFGGFFSKINLEPIHLKSCDQTSDNLIEK